MTAITWAEKSLMLEELDAAERAFLDAEQRLDIVSQQKRDARQVMKAAEARRDALQDKIYGALDEEGGD